MRMVADEVTRPGDPAGDIGVGGRPAALQEERGARRLSLEDVQDPLRNGSTRRAIGMLGVEGERHPETCHFSTPVTTRPRVKKRRVCRSGVPDRYSTGPKKSFQLYTRWKIATATTTGMACGRRTDQRVRNGPAPSMAAASSISVGMVMKYWRIRNTSKAFAKNVGTSSGSQVPTQPSF